MNKRFAIRSAFRAAAYLLATALTAVFVLAIGGCGKEYTGFDESSLPANAADESVLAKWDEYEILKSVPRYKGGGIFDTIVNPSGDAVNVYYNATNAEDYLGYNAELSSAGFKLAPDSAVWTNEGTLGVPQYQRGDKMVTLVWSADGTLAICVAYK